MSSPPNQTTMADAALFLNQRFQDIDDATGYSTCMNTLVNADTRNFVVDFTDTEARCATDLSTEDIKLLVQSPRSLSSETRWINFWGGDLQQDSIKAIVEHYGISPRLVSLLCSEASNTYTVVRTKADSRDETTPKSPPSPISTENSIKDAEKPPQIVGGEIPLLRRPPI